MDKREITIKKLRFNSWHRGCKETDLIMGYFADHHLEQLSDTDLALYATLLDEADADIWDWVVGKFPPARAEYAPFIEKFREFPGAGQ